jgi:hypothetical protein
MWCGAGARNLDAMREAPAEFLPCVELLHN